MISGEHKKHVFKERAHTPQYNSLSGVGLTLHTTRARAPAIIQTSSIPALARMLSRILALERHGRRTVSLSWLGFKLQRQVLKENISLSLLNICHPVFHITWLSVQDMNSFPLLIENTHLLLSTVLLK